MTVAGGFIAIVANSTFAQLNGKFNFAYVAMPRKFFYHFSTYD